MKDITKQNLPLRIAIVGAGKMGRHHAVALQRIPFTASLVAVADSDFKGASTLASELGIPKAYESIERLIESERPDIVHICTSPPSHFALARLALEGGASVYIEKPFTETSAQANELIGLAHALGKHVCAGHQLLFEKPTLLAAPLVKRLGRIQHVESYFAFRQARRQDGRCPLTASEQLLDILPHPTYLLIHFLGPAAEEGPLVTHGLRVDERGSVHALVSAGEVTGVLTASLHARPVDSYVKVVGTRGALTLDYVRGIVVPSFGVGSTIDKILDPYSRAWTTATGSTRSLAGRILKKQRSYPGLVDAFSAFYAQVASGAPAAVSVTNIARTAELCDDVRHKLNAERAVPPPQRTVPTAPTVAVTGGTGMLGHKVVASLLKRGIKPLVLARRIPAASEQLAGVIYQAADLGAGQISLPRSILTVIHCAAETAGGWDAHQRNSIDATRNLISAMRDAGVLRLVHVSSLAVIDADARQPLTEDSPLERDGRRRGPYVWGKLNSERIAADAPSTHAMEVRIIRPGPLVDNSDFDPPGKLGRAIGSTFVAVGSPNATIPVCDVTRAGEIVAWTAEHFDEADPVVHAIDPTPASRRELVRRVRETMPKARIVWFPAPFLSLASLGAIVAQKLLRPRKSAVSVSAAFNAPRCDTNRVRATLTAMDSTAAQIHYDVTLR